MKEFLIQCTSKVSNCFVKLPIHLAFFLILFLGKCVSMSIR